MAARTLEPVARFDLVVTLQRDGKGAVKLELGDVLLTRGITAAELVTLLNDGRVRLGRQLDFEAANALAQQLEVGGTVVELVELEDASATVPAASHEEAVAVDELPEVDVALGDLEPPPTATPVPAPGLREVVLSIETGPSIAIEEPPPAPPSLALPDEQDAFAPLPDAALELAETAKLTVPPASSPHGVVASAADGVVPAAAKSAKVPELLRAATEVPCPRCREPLASDGTCPACEAKRKAALRHKLFGGALRERPVLRLGVGLGLALALGYLGAEPYARHATHAVAALEERADDLRYRPDPELRAQAAALDEEADAKQHGIGIRYAFVWLLVAGVFLAGWLLAT